MSEQNQELNENVSQRDNTAPIQAIDESPIQPRVVKMPETPEQLEEFIAAALGGFLNIEANATILATVVVGGLARALTNDRERFAKDMNRLILVKAPFPGSIRAEVKSVETTDGDKLNVELKHIVLRDGENVWDLLTTEQYPTQKLEALTHFVLAKATAPGEVWYITTSLAVDRAAEEGASLLQAANGVEQ